MDYEPTEIFRVRAGGSLRTQDGEVWASEGECVWIDPNDAQTTAMLHGQRNMLLSVPEDVARTVDLVRRPPHRARAFTAPAAHRMIATPPSARAADLGVDDSAAEGDGTGP